MFKKKTQYFLFYLELNYNFPIKSNEDCQIEQLVFDSFLYVKKNIGLSQSMVTQAKA